jgi:hypothetical protein
MALNMQSIMGKVKTFAKSGEGLVRQDAAVQEAIKKRNGTLRSGKKVLTEELVDRAVGRFIWVLAETGRSYGLPASVMQHLENADNAGLHFVRGEGVTYIYFGGDMSRPSLDEDYGDGIKNIVALFNNGYHARDYAYGWWDNHEYKPIGEDWNSVRGFAIDVTSAYIRSRKDREGLHFIQEAVDDFNGNYGSMFNAVAEIANEIYKE